jgi:hypothetical protein
MSESVLLQLTCPADLLLYFLEALEEKEVEVGVDAHRAVRLPRPFVREHEGHTFVLHLNLKKNKVFTVLRIQIRIRDPVPF